MSSPLKVEILGDASKLDRATREGAESVDRFDKDVSTKGGGLASLGGKAAAMGTAVAAGMAVGVAAIAAGVGVGLTKLAELGGGFDGLADSVRIGTGKTGEALDKLVTQAQGQFESVPVSMDDAGAAVVRLGKGLGLTGKDLGDMSTQVLNLSRITGEDLGGTITTTRGLLNSWGVDAAQMPGVLDSIFRATQLTDVGFNDLAGSLTSNGLQLRELGFGLDESTAMLAQLANAGIDAGDVMPGFKKIIGEAAKDGKDATTAFQDFFAVMKGAPSDTAAAQYAVEQLGAKAGPQLAALIRDGRLDYQGLLDQIRGGSDTINNAAGDTDDWAEKLTLLKNRGLSALRPVAENVFNGINIAVDTVSPYIDRLTSAFSEGGLSTAFSELGTIWTEVSPQILAGLGTLRDNALAWWDQNKEAIGQGLLSAIRWGIERLADARNWLLDRLGEWLPALGEWVQHTAVPYVETHWQGWVEAFVGWIGPMWVEGQKHLWGFLGKLGGWLISDGIPWAMAKGREYWGALLTWLKEEAAPAAVKGLQGILSAAGEWVTGTGIPWLKNKGGELRDSFLHWLSELPGKALEAGSNLIAGLWDGLKRKMGDVLSGLGGGLAAPLVNALKAAFGIQSPSRVTMEIGEQLAAGLAVGVYKGMPAVGAAFNPLDGRIESLRTRLASYDNTPYERLDAIDERPARDQIAAQLRDAETQKANEWKAAFGYAAARQQFPDTIRVVLTAENAGDIGEFVVGGALARQGAHL